MYSYDFCIFVATYSKDFRLARICCESIRHFYPDTPIVILRDGDFSIDQLLALGNVHLYDDSQTPEPLRGVRGAFAKLKLFFNPYAERFLYLDADIVLIGPILDLPYHQYDFYMHGSSYNLASDADRKHLTRQQYDIDCVRAFDPGFGRESVNAFVTGAWFGRANALPLQAVVTPYVHYMGLPPHERVRFSRLYEQGMLSYILHKYDDEGVINVGLGQFEIRPAKDLIHRYPALNLDAVKAKTYHECYNLHYTARRRHIILRRMVYGDIPAYFNQKFYSRFPKWVQIRDDLSRLPSYGHFGIQIIKSGLRQARAVLRVAMRKSPPMKGGSMFDKLRKQSKVGLDSLLRSRGYRLERPPGILLDHPEAELQIDLDFVLCHCLVHHFEPGSFRDLFFVEIGAYDGSTNDPIHAYAKRYSWRGIVVEPQAEYYGTLLKTYAHQPGVIAVNAAIDSENRSRTLYRVRPGTPGLPVWATQLASFDRNHLLKHKSRIPNIEDILIAQEVPCMTLDTLLDQYSVERVDLLQIDTEGFDSEIIKMINFERIQPYIIVYEHKHLSRGSQQEALKILQAHGYKITMSRSNTVAYRRA